MKRLILLSVLSFLGLFSWQVYSLDEMVIEMPTLARSVSTAEYPARTSVEARELPSVVSYQPSRLSNSLYSWDLVTADQASYFADQLSYELSKYPADFFDRAGINKIYIVDNIEGRHNALGFADTASGEVYINLPSQNQISNPYILSTIHHEIAHIYFISLKGFSVINDAYWQTIFSSSQDTSVQEFPSEGLVSNYAGTSVAEDMAEVFAFMLTDDYRQQLATELRDDKILEDKVEYILSLSSRFYPDSSWLDPR